MESVSINFFRFQKLEIYQLSKDLVKNVYILMKKFPSEERFALIPQLSRAAVSVPSNIAEGAGRKNTKEFLQFLYISLGSASELHTQLIISQNLSYLKDTQLIIELNEIRKMLVSLIHSISKNNTH